MDTLGDFTVAWYTSQFSIQEAVKIPEVKAKEEKMEQIPDNSQRDVKKVRPKPEVVRQAKKGGKNSSLREFDGPLSLEERRTCETPPEIQGPSCAPGETTSKTKKDTEQFEQSKVLQHLS